MPTNRDLDAAAEILRGYVLGTLGDWEVVGWALEAVATGKATPDLEALAQYDPGDPSSTSDRLTELLVAVVPGADGVTPIELRLRHEASRLLSGEARPIDFCTLVRRFEAEIEDRGLPYPAWIGDLWHACDWCDETWTLDNAGALKDEAEKLVG